VTTFASATAVSQALASVGYIADQAIATTVFLADQLEKPVLVEGPPGVGKTELAKAMAQATGRELIRLQCYEGLDEAKTLYEWKYPKQLLYTQMLQGKIADVVADAATLGEAVDRIAAQEDAFFSLRFLEPRPLLAAIRSDQPSVLLIDEVDRAEDELEAFFLEVLAEFQVTVPELGTVRAIHRPLVFLTSNSSRELSDALRRRCLYLPLDFPGPEREAAIIASRAPEVPAALAAQVARFVTELRTLDLKKLPSISETIDWARAVVLLGARELAAGEVEASLNLLLKFEGDLRLARERTSELLDKSRAPGS
jgi:MoxR-like ATPase